MRLLVANVATNQNGRTSGRVYKYTNTITQLTNKIIAMSKPQRGYNCCIKGCRARYLTSEEVSFHVFPKPNSSFVIKVVNGEKVRVDRFVEWQARCEVDKVTPHTKICSLHFENEDFFLPEYSTKRRRLNPCALPTRNLPGYQDYNENNSPSALSTASGRCPTSRVQNEETNVQYVNRHETPGLQGSTIKYEVEILNEDDPNAEEDPLSTFDEVASSADELIDDVSCSEDNCTETFDRQDTIFVDVNAAHLRTTQVLSNLRTEKADKSTQTSSEDLLLTTTLNQSIKTEDEGPAKVNQSIIAAVEDRFVHYSSYIKTDHHLSVMCGIHSNAVLNKLVQLMSKCYPDIRFHEMSIKDRIVLTTMKLKLDLNFEALAVMFSIVDETVCRAIFHDSLRKLSAILRSSIRWPTKEKMKPNTSECLQNTMVVVDCIEFRVQDPKCLQCRLKLYAQYKSSLTAKFMTGVSPDGQLIFLSEGYGGQASDKAIFEKSGIINLLNKGDAVMADEGFQIGDICIRNGIQYYSAPLLKQTEQLSQVEVVEKINQSIRDFDILQHEIPWNLARIITDIVNVCAGLANLGTSSLALNNFV